MDLTTKYLGMTIKNPLVPSASPLSKTLDTARALEDAGAAALILASLFEEAIVAEEETMARFLHHQDTGFGEAESFLPAREREFLSSLDRYLEHLATLKQSLDIPVIASLNGITPGGWIRNARVIEEAGADALELNVYYVAADPEQSGVQVEQRYLALLRDLEQHIAIPVNMKLSPSFSSVSHMVSQLEKVGVNGVALFNRFYQPDINIDSMRLVSSLSPSNSTDALLAMRWIAILHGRTELSLGATGGVHTAEDAIKLLLAGADVVHLCSALLAHGPAYLGKVLEGIRSWMEEQGMEGLDQIRGRVSQSTIADPTEFERANYIKVLDGYSISPGAWM
uniref:Dihydroorotate dehydrogenase (Fumarate) n=1 Tax=Candidatus Kentrum sp. FM TaxID=2126340 RepID=A0A450RUN3_9GAMM|nr:MAG: dihydroorotate dehydrogenase (fumarate) [Candidatus Kentron sp. FM]VFJ43511.1 MAG: dihydroorotate dehydrogenase (fumarate) [Candidatus Kentron sp. FM]VFK05552.1 MAG: dihydroorotate dehydrogenase (fumarate) [Candidatus Kentron sp. FM]